MQTPYYYVPFKYDYGFDPYQAYANVPYPYYHTNYSYYVENRQQPIRGQATWTEGGQVTQCNIPWSKNEFMTVAVGQNAPYQCGQTLRIKYPATQREVVVTIVDKVAGFPSNRVNLHRTAFLALGADAAQGVINVEIYPSPELEEEKWGKYLLEVTQTAYPNYNVTDYDFVTKTNPAPNQVKEEYDFILIQPKKK
ncbi:rare lipoprotein A [Salirhabdus euzebyi]|uniref:Rare lipoprotein A n=1 Tax=Salirhabdus euzebyi TaxID=394506 RepID=A0A841PZB6_9BACI|nr:RlpA-like double-psi beta-barrel domain-containing protein [Salirhabdus euzebyi]MBB6452681.1 rare lipoprotein A [Salirhabdus euzebyi]